MTFILNTKNNLGIEKPGMVSWAQRMISMSPALFDQSSQGAESSFPAGPKLEFGVSQLKLEKEAFKIRSHLEKPRSESFQFKMFRHTRESLIGKRSKLCFPAFT